MIDSNEIHDHFIDGIVNSQNIDHFLKASLMVSSRKSLSSSKLIRGFY